MAYIICDIHGGHGAAFVCPHLAQDILEKTENAHKIVPVTVNYENQLCFTTRLCVQCAGCHAIPLEGIELVGESGLERWYSLDTHPVCSKCFDEQFSALREIT